MTNELIVLLTSMAPISELRGAIPLGINLGLIPLESLALSLIGNLLIVPILLLIVKPVFTYFKTLKQFRLWINKYEDRAANKVKNYRKYRLLGLFLLVAVPIPTTGVYTGAVAANVLNISFKNAWIAISMGVLVAGGIVYMISLNLIHLL
ncbi:MAG: small multi-drug export protein [Clostridiales bacterium]|nr:small multi-drug export protein [Clostridiales bacterium]